jgi:polyisoprenoid-binding protein YceI
MKKSSIPIFALALALSMSAVALAETGAMNPCGSKTGMVFHVDDPMARNTVTFKSTAPLEDIIGTSNDIAGKIWFDPKNPEKGGHGELVVPVASLNTGIPLRDDHLRGADWLNADRFPDIVLKINRIGDIRKVRSTDGIDTYDLIIYGDFSFHGKTLPVEFPGRITYLQESEMTKMKMPGNLLAARASFEVPLKAFGVTGPSGMNLIGSKVGKTIEIDVSLMGNTASAMAGAGNPCGGKEVAGAGNPCGGKATAGAGNPCGGKAMKEVGNPCGAKDGQNAGNPCSR